MAAGSAYFGFGAARATERRWQILYMLNFFICLIATALYLTMATGYGSYIAADGTPTVWVRYVTWGLSTPLLILDLTFLGRSPMPLTAALIGADVFMIGTGLVATLVAAPWSLLWYVISCGAFLAIFVALLGAYRRHANAVYTQSGDLFNRIVGVHLFLWTLYPVVWIVSAEGFGIVGPGIEAASYTILDVVAKVGFGLLALSTLRTLEQRGEPVPA